MEKSYSESYAAAGVDITAGYRSVELMKQKQHPLHGTHSSGHVGLLAREAKHRTPADCRDRELLFQ